MKVIKVNNVNDAFYRGLDLFGTEINYRRQESRNGPTLEANEPVTTVYHRPWQRVLFDKRRDANPFFHLFESIWMMAGRRDLKTLTPFNAGMKNFSDDMENLNGAYGHRWINYWHDQIDTALIMLLKDPNSRRVVLQMWDPVHDLDSPSKDIPCNTNIYFKIRENKLEMTVCNRSNDMIWGAYGANAVHMSILQEYMASALDVGIGDYRQVSDSFHVYENELWKKLFPTDYGFTLFGGYPNTIPVVTKPRLFINECKFFMNELESFDWKGSVEASEHFNKVYANNFFDDVIYPMLLAFIAHKKERNYVKAESYLEQIKAEDWQIACRNWILKRRTNYEGKNG